MKKNRIDIEIVGLDFRQDVEPLIKEFFPGFFHESGVRITIDARETSFEIRVEMSGKWSEDSKKSCSEGSYKENRGEEDPYEVDRDGANPDGKRSEDSRICLETESFDLSDFGDEKARHREYRNRLLRALYKVLHEFTGESLPWGILTGVRPTKLLFERIERGEGKPLQFMEEKYFCSREKASLAAQVAAVEYQLLDSIDYRNGYSLYAGIPFCPSICNYCTFGSHPIGKFSELVEPYIEALMKEISAVSGIYHDRVEPVGIMDERKKDFFKPRRLETVYIGGGTPTSLTAEQLRRVIRCIKDNFDMGGVVEFSVEAGRPDSITEEKLCMLKEEGITRISINPQTFSQKTLDIIGRAHSPEQVISAFMTARKLGFDNINMDLIAGLTGEDEKDFAHTLDCVNLLDPDSLTVHTLARKRAARITTDPEMYEKYDVQSTSLAGEAGYVAGMLKLAESYTKENGYVPYYMYRQKNMTENLENVGYAKPGKECLYNILIMEEVQPIMAVGAGASTKFPYVSGDKRFGRIENVKNVREYINRIDEMIERKKNAFS